MSTVTKVDQTHLISSNGQRRSQSDAWISKQDVNNPNLSKKSKINQSICGSTKRQSENIDADAENDDDSEHLGRCRSPTINSNFANKYKRKTSPRSRHGSNSNRVSAASDSTNTSECDPRGSYNGSSGIAKGNSQNVSNSKRLMNLSKKYLHETFEGRKWNRFTLGTLPRRKGGNGDSGSADEEDDDNDTDSLVSSSDDVLDKSLEDADVTPSATSIVSKNSQACQTSCMKISVDSVATDRIKGSNSKPKQKTRVSQAKMEDKKVGDSLPRPIKTGRNISVYKPPSSNANSKPGNHGVPKSVSSSCQTTENVSNECVYENMEPNAAPPVPPRTYLHLPLDTQSNQTPPVPPRKPSITPEDGRQILPRTPVESNRHSTASSNCSLHSDQSLLRNPHRPNRNYLNQEKRQSQDSTGSTCKRHSQLLHATYMHNIEEQIRVQLENAEKRKSGGHMVQMQTRSHSCDRTITPTTPPGNSEASKAYVPMHSYVLPSQTQLHQAGCRNSRNFSMMANNQQVTTQVSNQQVSSQGANYTRYQRSRSQASTKEYPKQGRLSRFFSRGRSVTNDKKPSQNYINFYQGQQNCHDTGTISQEILSAGEDAKQFALKRAALQKQLAATKTENSTVNENLNRLNSGEMQVVEVKLSKTNPFYDQMIEETRISEDRPSVILPVSNSRSSINRNLNEFIDVDDVPILPPKDRKTQSLTLGDSAKIVEKSNISRKLMSVLRFPFSRRNSKHGRDSRSEAKNILPAANASARGSTASAASSRRPASYVSNVSNCSNGSEYFNRKSVTTLNSHSNRLSNAAALPVSIHPSTSVTGVDKQAGSYRHIPSSLSGSGEQLIRPNRSSFGVSFEITNSSVKQLEAAGSPISRQSNKNRFSSPIRTEQHIAGLESREYDTPHDAASSNGTMKSGAVSAELYETLDCGLDEHGRDRSIRSNFTTVSNATPTSTGPRSDGVHVSKKSLRQLSHQTPLTVTTNEKTLFSEVSTFPLNKTSPKSSPDGCDVSNKLQTQNVNIKKPPTKSSAVFVTVNIGPKKPSPSLNQSSPRVPKRSPLMSTERELKKTKLPFIQPPSAPTVTCNSNWSSSAPSSVQVTPVRPSSFKFVDMESTSMSGSQEFNVNNQQSQVSRLSSQSERKLNSLTGNINTVFNVHIDDVPDKLVTTGVQIPQQQKMSPKSPLGHSPTGLNPQPKTTLSYAPLNTRLDTIMSETSCDELETSGFRTNSDSDEYKCLLSGKHASTKNDDKKNEKWDVNNDPIQSDFERTFEDVVSEADYMSEAEFSTVDRMTFNSRVFGLSMWKNKPNVFNGGVAPPEPIPEVLSQDFNEAVKLQVAQMESLNKEPKQTTKINEIYPEKLPVSMKNLRDIRDVDFSEFSRQLSLTEAFSVEDKVRGYHPDSLHERYPDQMNIPARVSPGAKSSSWGRGSVSSAISSVSSRPPTRASHLLNENEDCDYFDDSPFQNESDFFTNSLTSEKKSKPTGMVDGGRTHVIDASSLNGGKSKSGSLRSTDDIEGSSSAGGASQSSNRSISSKVSLNRSKDNSTEDNLYDSIEMLNSGRRHTQLKTNESAASSVKSSVTRHATASSRQILMEHRKSNSHAAVNLQRDMGESGDSGGESATYSQVNRHTHHITHAKSQPCSPLPLGVSPRGSSQARRITQMPPYKHGKSKSELVPCGIPVLDTSPIKPPLTQERLIYERMDSAESAEANNRGSKGSLLGSTIVQHGSSSRASVGSPISMTNTSGTPLNQQLSSSSSQDSRTKSKDWDLDRHSLDNNLTTFEDVGAHIYDEVAEEEERKSTNSGKKDLLAGQKVSAVIPKQTGKTKSSLSRSLDADSIVTGDDNAVKSETKKKTGKLRKQKSFTKKWLSNKTNSSATASNATPNSGSAAVPVTSASSYFGQPLEKLILIGNDGSQSPMPPLFVTQCIRYIELHGLDSEGIYRQPGNQCDREKLIHWFDKSVQDSGLSVQVNEDTLGPIVNQMSMPVDSVASALKQFFSKLPHPLIPVKYHDLFMRAALIGSGSSTGKLASHLALLPVPNYVTLRCLSLHLNKIANRCDVNKMTSENLATCFWPTLLRPAYTSLDAMSGSYKCRQLVEVIINRCHELFSYNTPRPDSDVQV